MYAWLRDVKDLCHIVKQGNFLRLSSSELTIKDLGVSAADLGPRHTDKC